MGLSPTYPKGKEFIKTGRRKTTIIVRWCITEKPSLDLLVSIFIFYMSISSKLTGGLPREKDVSERWLQIAFHALMLCENQKASSQI